nr:MAG TPA: DNA encapsidation protein [Caudoviricetes sp.]
MSKKFDYYSFDKILSRNAVFNMVMGARGVGKSYGAKKYVLKRAIERGEEFIYLRRYKTELKTRGSFVADVAPEFPEQEFEIRGGALCWRNKGEGKDAWRKAGYFLALSTSAQHKSTPYPKVTTIIFDEFIIETGTIHYLKDEVKTLLDFYSTVDRYQDRTRVLMLSNAISIMNPYFIKWHITPTPGKVFITYGDGFVAAQFVDSDRFASQVATTRFGRFVTDFDEEYADYSIDNAFADNTNQFVQRKSGTAEYMFTVKTDLGVFSLWMDGGTLFCQQKRPRVERVYNTNKMSLREGEVLMSYSDKIAEMLRGSYRKGRVFFDSPQSRNAFAEIFVR